MATDEALTRRQLFRTAAMSGVATALGVGWGGRGPQEAEAAPNTPQEALQALRDGNARWVAHNETSFVADLNLINSGATETHQPFAALLSCADARVSPEFLFDQIMGDLFITRVAGNIATPEIIASLEYSVAVLGTVKAIMVLGHGACGAVGAASSLARVTGTPSAPLMTSISALYAPLRAGVALGGSTVDGQIRANARYQAALLTFSSPVISDAIKINQLAVVPAYYDIASGRVTELPPLTGAIPIP